jgi:hypothetical protein
MWYSLVGLVGEKCKGRCAALRGLAGVGGSCHRFAFRRQVALWAGVLCGRKSQASGPPSTTGLLRVRGGLLGEGRPRDSGGWVPDGALGLCRLARAFCDLRLTVVGRGAGGCHDPAVEGRGCHRMDDSR